MRNKSNHFSGCFAVFGLCLSLLALSACETSALTSIENVREASVMPLSTEQQGSGWLLASETDGLQLLNSQAEPVASLSGAYGLIDSRSTADGWLVMSVLRSKNQPQLLAVTQQAFTPLLQLPVPDFKVEDLCLYRDAQQHLYGFLVDGRGQAEQWLLAQDGQALSEARLVRQLNLPPETEFCSVDDTHHTLFVSEEAVGVWAIDATPEGAPERHPVALLAPFGNLQGEVAGIAAVKGGVIILDSERKQLLGYQFPRQDEGDSLAVPVVSSAVLELDDPDGMSLMPADNTVAVAIIDEGVNRAVLTQLDWVAAKAEPVLPVVLPLQQTASMPQFGDAADDPAIWINTAAPEKSLVLGTNKQAGLFVYDLQGQELQRLNSGRLNNVDVRQQISKANAAVDVAVASRREDNTVLLFEIDSASGEVQSPAVINTGLNDIYGICLYQSREGVLYTFVNDKDGRFHQIALTWSGNEWQGELVREFRVDSQPEGCVADDARGTLFVGEEDVGIWTIGADMNAGTELSPVLMASPQLVPDVEGLALYQDRNATWLVVSSQGNNSYLIVESVPPYAIKGAFRVGLNAAAGIDGSSETDGLEVTAFNLGGPWQQGMLVVQDGHNVMPVEPQNFKLIPWSAIDELLGLTD